MTDDAIVTLMARALQDRDDSFAPGSPLDPAYIADSRAVIAALSKSGYEILWRIVI